MGGRLSVGLGLYKFMGSNESDSLRIFVKWSYSMEDKLHNLSMPKLAQRLKRNARRGSDVTHRWESDGKCRWVEG